MKNTEKSSRNNPPAGLRERLDYNADFRLDWHDPDEATDGYQLKWIGKDYARLQTGAAPATVVSPDARWNAKPESAASENLFFTGDNIEVLKHLQNAYHGAVDMIYIDPPYNTGKEFVYSDRFDFTDEQLKGMLDMTDNEIKRLHTINGRSSHSAWLTFMYPRLRLARALLKDTGVIFISIDDNEQANLRLLCDEVFGEGNFVAELVWKCRNSLQHDEPLISKQTERILLFAKNRTVWSSESGLALTRIRKPFDATEYKNPDNDPRGPWLSSGKIRNDGRPSYTVVSPSGVKFTKPWVPSPTEFKRWEEEQLIWWGANGDSIPRKKAFLKDFSGNAISDILFDEYTDEIKGENNIKRIKRWEIGTTESGTKAQKDIFDGKVLFDYPKPCTLIKYLVTIATPPAAVPSPNPRQSADSPLILDFFAGSGTTAHAVMQLNAEDGGNRRWILAQLDEPTAAESEARKAGFKTIDEIARERIKRAASQIKKDAGLNAQNLDLGFRHFRVRELDTPTIDKITEFDPSKPAQKDMFENMAGKIGVDTILATWLCADCCQLRPGIVTLVEFAGITAYHVDNKLYLLNEGWGTKQTKTLLNEIGTYKLNVNTIIVFGYSFTMESLRELEINVKQSLNKQVTVETRY